MGDPRDYQPYKPISILIVDDHPLFRDGLQKALELETDIVVVGHCEDGETALMHARELAPDVVLLDINLPELNGLQVARQLRMERHNVAIIMLTAYHDTEQVLHAMRSGAMAYCNKDIRPDKLVETIRLVVQGYRVVDDRHMEEREFQEWMSAKIQAATGPYTLNAEDHYIPLSPRETEILQYVTEGLSNKEIAAKLRISQQTVKNHMTSILNKMNVNDRTQAAVTALRNGWVRIKSSQEKA